MLKQRFLFVVPPFVGHINPTISVGLELINRGHSVAWTGYPDPLQRLLPSGTQFLPLDSDSNDVKFLTPFKLRNIFLTMKFVWEDVFIPLTRKMLPGVVEVAQRFQPDVLISDQQTLAGALAARTLGLVWATSATTPADRVRSLEWIPKVLAWSEEQLAELQREAGLTPLPTPEDSPFLVLSFTTEALSGTDERAKLQYRFVGPSVNHRNDDTPFPWDRLLPVPRILVSLGTAFAEHGGTLLEKIKLALADLPVQVILIAPDSMGPFPDNFITLPWAPQLRVLAAVDLFLSHGGNNSICEALAQALPVVVFPFTVDQPLIARQVVNAGCGLSLSFRHSDSNQIRDAVQRVLSEPGYRVAAARIRQSFEQAGGARRAAELLETLAHQKHLP